MNIINVIFIKIKSVMSYLFWHEKWQPKVLFFFFFFLFLFSQLKIQVPTLLSFHSPPSEENIGNSVES